MCEKEIIHVVDVYDLDGEYKATVATRDELEELVHGKVWSRSACGNQWDVSNPLDKNSLKGIDEISAGYQYKLDLRIRLTDDTESYSLKEKS